MKEKQLLGRQIKRLRARLGLTQDALAERVQISPKYLSNIERGRENPTLDTLLRLAKSLKVEPWEVFLVDTEPLDRQALRTKIGHLLEQADDEEQLRLVVRLMQAAFH
jgi:transcriptional regulator with XRE-family HTH domain